MGQSLDSSSSRKDSLTSTNADSVHADNNKKYTSFFNDYAFFDSILITSPVLSLRNGVVPVTMKARTNRPKDSFFYVLVFTLLILGIFKTIFGRYFNNMLRVFLNTSLRQSQLTDQMLQSKSASVFFSILFYLVSGQYLFYALAAKGIMPKDRLDLMFICVISVGFIFIVKSIVIRLVGWLTGNGGDAILYNFIVSLSNNILTLLLLPLLFLIAFADTQIKDVAIAISFFFVGAAYVFRYLRAFGNLQRHLKVGTFHFLLYIISIEILPLILLYKIAWDFLTIYL